LLLLGRYILFREMPASLWVRIPVTAPVQQRACSPQLPALRQRLAVTLRGVRAHCWWKYGGASDPRLTPQFLMPSYKQKIRHLIWSYKSRDLVNCFYCFSQLISSLDLLTRSVHCTYLLQLVSTFIHFVEKQQGKSKERKFKS